MQATYRKRRPVGLTAAYAILILWAVISLLPLYWVFATSLQLTDEVMKMPPQLIPSVFLKLPGLLLSGQLSAAQELVHDALSSYRYLFQSTDIGRWFWNSSFVAVIGTAVILLFDSMAAYAFAKMRFPGRDVLFWIMISTMMIPGQVTLVPMFIIARDLNLLDTLWALILPDIAMVFGVFLLRQFIRTIPSELIEAAKIDGATEIGIYARIIVPLAKPGLATLGILSFMAIWNSFIWPLIVLNGSAVYTLPVGLKTLQDQNLVQYGLLMSGAAVAAIPMIIVFLSFQRYFIKGLTLGGLKG